MTSILCTTEGNLSWGARWLKMLLLFKLFYVRLSITAFEVSSMEEEEADKKCCWTKNFLFIDIIWVIWNGFYVQGGRHVDYVSEQIVTNIIEVVKKKEKKGGVGIRPFQVSYIW